MRALLIALLLAPLLPLTAQARPDSLATRCADLQALVQRDGAAVIGTGPNLYDRFVANPGYCASQRSEPAWIPARDVKQCLVGQRCRERRYKYRN